MKKLKLAISLLFFIAISPKIIAQEKAISKNKVEIKIMGLTCAGCASQISQILSNTKGVLNQELKYPGNVAVITYDAKSISPKELVAAIKEQTNFKAEIKSSSDTQLNLKKD